MAMRTMRGRSVEGSAEQTDQTDLRDDREKEKRKNEAQPKVRPDGLNLSDANRSAGSGTDLKRLDNAESFIRSRLEQDYVVRLKCVSIGSG